MMERTRRCCRHGLPGVLSHVVCRGHRKGNCCELHVDASLKGLCIAHFADGLPSILHQHKTAAEVCYRAAWTHKVQMWDVSANVSAYKQFSRRA